MRWTEEVELLQEEMRRVLQFLGWKADWWDERARLWELDMSTADLAQSEGNFAFAKQQASFYRSLQAHFKGMWQYVEAYVGLGNDVAEPEVPDSDGEDA